MGHSAPETQDAMQRRLVLHIEVRQRAPVLELLAREDQPLLVRRDALLALDLRLHVLHRVARLDLERDRLASLRLHKNLHVRLVRRAALVLKSLLAVQLALVRKSLLAVLFFSLRFGSVFGSDVSFATLLLENLQADSGGQCAPRSDPDWSYFG